MPFGPGRWTESGVHQLLSYGQSILSAVRAGAGQVSNLWDAVKRAGYEVGTPASHATIMDMNEVAGRARAVSSAWDAFAGARPDAAVTSEHWAWSMGARPAEARGVTEQWQMRYAVDVEGPHGTYTMWRTANIDGSLDGWTRENVLSYVQESFTQLQAGARLGSSPLELADDFAGGVVGSPDAGSVHILRMG